MSYDAMIEAIERNRRFHAGHLLYAIAALIVLLIVWAAFAEIDTVTRGQGKVVPSRQLQVIESFEGGIVRVLRVREGDVVEQGQLLMELDPTIALSEFDRSSQQYYALKARIARLSAEVAGRTPDFADELAARAGDVTAAEQALFDGRAASRQAELRVLDRKLFQRRQELREARSRVATLEASLALIDSELAMTEPLVARKLEPRKSLLDLKRQQTELGGQRAAETLATARLEAAIAEVEEQRTAFLSQRRQEALSELSLATASLSELQPALPAMRTRLERTEIRSPVRGVVNRLLLTTIGGVAKPGEPLIEVVPMDDTLLVEAMIPTQDIAFLRPGDPARVRLTAYDFARYGSLEAHLVTIGADAVEDTQSGQLHYVMRVRTLGTLTDAAGQPLPVIPGMIADVDILTGQRSILDYFLRPVAKVKEKAFRE